MRQLERGLALHGLKGLADDRFLSILLSCEWTLC